MNRSCDSRRPRHRIPLPRIRIENGIANIVVGRAVEVLRPALRGDADLSAGRAAILGCVIGGKDLDFLRGVHVRSADTGAVRARAYRGSAVIGDEAFRRARAVDVRWPLSEIET